MNNCCVETLKKLMANSSPIIMTAVQNVFGADAELIAPSANKLPPPQVVIIDNLPWFLFTTRPIVVLGKNTGKYCRPGQDYCSDCGHVDDAETFFKLKLCPNEKCSKREYWNG